MALKREMSSQWDLLYLRYSLFVSSVLGQNHCVKFDVPVVVSAGLRKADLVKMVLDAAHLKWVPLG